MTTVEQIPRRELLAQPARLSEAERAVAQPAIERTLDCVPESSSLGALTGYQAALSAYDADQVDHFGYVARTGLSPVASPCSPGLQTGWCLDDPQDGGDESNPVPSPLLCPEHR